MVANKVYSTMQEKRIAKFLGWDTVSASGARDFNPGDIKSSKFLGECKTHRTVSDTIVFKYADWIKIKEEAKSVFKTPVLFVDNGSQNLEDTWCIFSEGCCNDSVVIHDCAISGNKTLKVLTTILKSMKTLIKCYSAEDLNHYHVISVHLGGEKVILCDVYNFATIFC